MGTFIALPGSGGISGSSSNTSGPGAGTSQSLSNAYVWEEVPNGIKDGQNVTFTTAHTFIPESLMVEINGLGQKLVNDYTVAGGRYMAFNIAPLVNDMILVNYIRA